MSRNTLGPEETEAANFDFVLTLWTDDPELAEVADAAGVQRVGLDLETAGKSNRQSTDIFWISSHNPERLDAVKSRLKRADFFVRTNAIGPLIRDEIEKYIGHGANVLMLPNFTTRKELERYVEIVDGRATVVPLVERLAAVELIPEFRELGLEEFHVGLNDLSIDLDLPNRLGILTLPIVNEIASAATAHGLRFGLGGVARPGDTSLPVRPDLVHAALVRLGAGGALLARSFFTAPASDLVLKDEIARLHRSLAEWQRASFAEHEAARLELEEAVSKLAMG